MNDMEYRLATLDRIQDELARATTHQLHDVLQYLSNPVEFEMIDKYIYSKLEIEKYQELKEKYPDEFV